jgi:hypothetical protein
MSHRFTNFTKNRFDQKWMFRQASAQDTHTRNEPKLAGRLRPALSSITLTLLSNISGAADPKAINVMAATSSGIWYSRIRHYDINSMRSHNHM